ncbi:hypothetical protein AwDysgo_10420 [Bacteroidales bacterium]|nr:hypothetical protein AwDysgo_10420 [Bacteroidales bacterium]
MKKLIISMFMFVALCATSTVSAQDANKADCTKAKTECTKDKKECTDKKTAECTKKDEAKCCKDKKGSTADTKSSGKK